MGDRTAFIGKGAGRACLEVGCGHRMHSMWRARNPDNPRSVAAQNERSTRRFVPFASSVKIWCRNLKKLMRNGARRRETYFHQAALEKARGGTARQGAPCGRFAVPLTLTSSMIEDCRVIVPPKLSDATRIGTIG